MSLYSSELCSWWQQQLPDKVPSCQSTEKEAVEPSTPPGPGKENQKQQWELKEARSAGGTDRHRCKRHGEINLGIHLQNSAPQKLSPGGCRVLQTLQWYQHMWVSVWTQMNLYSFFKHMPHIMQTHKSKVFISLISTNFTNQEFFQQGYRQISSLTIYF